MTIPMLIAGGVVLLLIVWFALTRSAPAIEFADDAPDWEVWDDEPEEDTPYPSQEQILTTRYQMGALYGEDRVWDLLWATGYGRTEGQKMINQGYVAIYRNGLSAAFSWIDRDDLWQCQEFDPEADTESSDRWRRQPTDDERRSAVWGE